MIRQLDIDQQLTKQQPEQQQEQQKKKRKSKLYNFVSGIPIPKDKKIVGGRMTVKDKRKKGTQKWKVNAFHLQ